jgi:hypothetical protein
VRGEDAHIASKKINERDDKGEHEHLGSNKKYGVTLCGEGSEPTQHIAAVISRQLDSLDIYWTFRSPAAVTYSTFTGSIDTVPIPSLRWIPPMSQRGA